MKKAVLVGIHSNPGKSLGKVPGAHKDVQRLQKLLEGACNPLVSVHAAGTEFPPPDNYNYSHVTLLVDTNKVLEHVPHQWPSEKNIVSLSMLNLKQSLTQGRRS